MEDLAERAELSKQAVWLIEDGRSQPRRTTAQRIAEALGVEVEELYRPLTPAENPAGLQAMLDSDLADSPPTAAELQELREIPFRGEPDAVSYLYALQAIRRANARLQREGGDDASSTGDDDDPGGGLWDGGG